MTTSIPHLDMLVERNTSMMVSQRVILITGAGSGIGSRRCARSCLLLRFGHRLGDGASLWLARLQCDVRRCEPASGRIGARLASRACVLPMRTHAQVCKKILQNGGRASSTQCDVTDEIQVASMIEKTVDVFGRIDAAFNNAGRPHCIALTRTRSNVAKGVLGKRGLAQVQLWEASEYDAAMDVNAKGVFLCMKHEILQFQKQQKQANAKSAAGDVAILNMASVAGLNGGQGQAAYAASKAAVIVTSRRRAPERFLTRSSSRATQAFTKIAAVEQARSGIRINCVCPSIIQTGIMGTSSEEQEMALHIARKNNPSRRVGSVFEVVNAVEFLLSPRSSFITGSGLGVCVLSSF